MNNASFSWLHLTDLHFGLKGQDTLWPNLRKPFLDDLAALHEITGPWQAVLFTGDLVQQGRSDEFKAMQQEVLDRLWQKLDELGSGDAVLLAVPGNHDLCRPNPHDDNPALDKLLEKERFADVAMKFWANPAGSYRRVVNDAFAAYSDWWKGAPHRPPTLTPGILPGDFSCTLDCGGHAVGIVGLNTAFFQLADGDYHSKLEWNVSQLHAVCDNAVDDWLGAHSICLLLTHHGPDWLSASARQHGATEIAHAGRFALHLYGHAHEASFQHLRNGGSPDAVRLCQSRSVFGMEMCGNPPALQREHGYTVGRIEFKHGQASLRLWPRVATDRPQGQPWRYIADASGAVLERDNGTRAETFPCRGVQAPVHPAAARSMMPSRRPFFGRDQELNEIATFLRPDYKGWGVVLDGPGGVGKTSLALEAAHAAPVELYPVKLFITAKSSRLDADGVHPMEDNRVADYFGMLTEIGRALGLDKIDSVPQDQRATHVRHALAAQRVLLVLDNLESFTREERRRIYDLLDFLPPGCRAIVTSRCRDETAARTLRLDKLDVYAAKQLLQKLGEGTRAIARLTEHEHQTLYAETGGSPLLLTWVAAQLGRTQGCSRTVEAAVMRLHEAYRKQKSNKHNDPLEFVFGELLDSFSRSEAAVLAALCHFSEPAPLACLLPIANLRESVARNALDDLRNRALLIEDEANGTWFLPPLCARFLRHRRRAAVSAAGARLQSQACELAARAGDARHDGYAELEAAWPIIQAALPLLVEGSNERLQQVCNKLHKFLDITGRWHRLLSLSQAAERKAQLAGDHANAGWRAYEAGCIHYRQGDPEAGRTYEKRCLEHWGAERSRHQMAAVSHLRAIDLLLQGGAQAREDSLFAE